MELTVAEALEQGIAAHREGNLEDAERLYRAILQAQPNHPDANHNLGVLAVSVGKPLEALPFFKLALEVNPQIEQFWLSYVDALIKSEQFDEAMKAVKQGTRVGIPTERLTVLSESLVGAQEQHERSKQKKKFRQTLDDVQPTQDQIDRVLALYQAEQFADAEALAVTLTEHFPEHPFAWKALGAIFNNVGRLDRAVVAMQKSVELSPSDALAHSNLGAVLKDLERLDESEISLKEAIALSPDYAEAHYNLGITLQALGRLNDAEVSYKRAITLNPEHAKAHNNLGNVFAAMSNQSGAISAYARAIQIQSNYGEAKQNLGNALKNVSFQSMRRDLYEPLINVLTTGNFVRPRDVTPAIISLLAHDPLIIQLLGKSEINDFDDVVDVMGIMNELPILHHLMRMCPLPNLELEEVFTGARSALLSNLQEVRPFPNLIHFMSTLAIHCFTNEYVYFETDAQICLIEELELRLERSLRQDKQPSLVEVLCFALYRPLHRYDWCHNIKVLDQCSDVKARLIEEPFVEAIIAEEIPMLGEISDDVSRKVRAQYEENPYPRWVNLYIAQKSASISEICDKLELNLAAENIRGVKAPKILVAGCGTGQHPIGTASRFSNCQVTAIDLSRASLAYAQRKTRELGLTNLEFLQADILEINLLESNFDVIECAGVLHHMNDPMSGWQALAGLLKPGGLMRIGLYSELARRQIVRIREEIGSLQLGSSAPEIRQFRQSIIESSDMNLQKITAFHDFFSLSEIRDLIFHEQECRFTIPVIAEYLDKLGLRFCGFEDPELVASLRGFYGARSDIHDLKLWDDYEQTHPETFENMYQFWCQKPDSHECI